MSTRIRTGGIPGSIIRRVRMAAIALSPLLTNACTAHVSLGPTSSRDQLSRLNARAVRQRSKVKLRNGQALEVDGLKFEQDSVYWVGPAGEKRVPRSEFLMAESKDRPRGALQGAIIGAGAGVIMGLLPCGEARFCYDTKGQEVSKGQQVALMTFSGALWGVIIGAIRGSRVQVTADPGG